MRFFSLFATFALATALPNSPPPQSSRAPYDTVVKIESSNYPGYFLGTDNGRGLIQNKECDTNKWKIVKSLVGCDKCNCRPGEDCVSFQSATKPDVYLRHRNYQSWADVRDTTDLFKNDASFCVASGNNKKDGFVSFRSVNYPDRFLRHYDYKVDIDTAALRNPQLFCEDTSFRFVKCGDTTSKIITPYDGIVKIESSNYPGYFLGTDNGRALIQNKACDTNKWKIVKSLVGCDKCNCRANEQCVSFESTTKPNNYLRHRNYQLWADPRDNADLYKNDASFCITCGNNKKDGYYSFRSVNYPDRFIRHYDYKADIDTAAQRNPQLFCEDTSFRFVKV